MPPRPGRPGEVEQVLSMVSNEERLALPHDGTRVRVVNSSRGAVLAEWTDVAASSWRRMRGLLGRPPLRPGQGLLIVPCRGVHSFGMAYSIDVVHLDRKGV